MDGTIVASGTLALLAGAAYVVLAAYSLRRPIQPSYRTAWRLFQCWWLSMGANFILTGVATIAAGMGSRNLALFVTQAYLERLLLAGGLAALLAYVCFIISGDRRTWIPIGIFYVGFYVLSVFQFARGRPLHIELHSWARPTLITSATASPGAQLAMLALLILPPIFASMMYFQLYFEAKERRQKVRIAVTSGGISFWFILSVTAYFVGDSVWLQVANRTLGLALAIAILYVTAAPQKDHAPRKTEAGPKETAHHLTAPVPVRSR